ncbi:competence type IV pilus minor pilin ComGD [Thalassobacillus pellis]|uniref:competence type IV pilus minor pilin ComGD n=1 Tax=Thalassobacillus pellis TaxID=748008 RepID=UPI001960419E|nr:competence type IV pilus minor pilin ComGD [Thalassobacillus pellis]MBM7552303.1 competence protein ComGD [Thalassobacillus pellis]
MTTLPEKSLSHQQPHNGFTLIEAILVLSIWSVLLLILIPVQHSIMEKKELKQFLHQLEDDVLLAQKLTMHDNRMYEFYILPSMDNYYLYDPLNQTKLLEARIPAHINLRLMTLRSPIRFSFDGTIKTPGIMEIRTDTTTYRIVFPFGKGRFYINEI